MLELYIGAACFFFGALFGTYATLWFSLRHLGKAIESSHAWREMACDIIGSIQATTVSKGAPTSSNPHDKKG